MTRDEAHALKVGDALRPLPLWNQTERVYKMAPIVHVETVTTGACCQTGVRVQVPALNGTRLDLDAGWFEVAR